MNFRDDSRSPSTTAVGKRWVPPSSLRRDALSPDEQDDLVFRKVRGHLNKLTPEKFEKLSEDILSIGLNSPKTLSGVIFLIFEKALDEPKYSSMYARLCKLLSERAPNFEGPKSSCNTFEKLLLMQCEEEFRNREKATEKCSYRKHGPLTPDEEEQRQIAKRKMLGNIKFIGELGKLEMVKERILHMCIETLLRKKRPSPINEASRGKRSAEGLESSTEVVSGKDLECLCQIMRTCGRLLDTPAAKGYFDQYFERMDQLSNNTQLPSRIRFLLQDVFELRRNKWVPRKVAFERGPQTIQEIRQEALRNNGVLMTNDRRNLGPVSRGVLGPVSGTIFGNMSGLMVRGQLKSGLDDVFGSLPIGTLELGTGPGVINTDFNFNNGFHTGRSKSGMFGRDGGGFMSNRDGGNFGNFQKGRGNSGPQSFGQNSSMNGNYGGASGKQQVPPRFQRKMQHHGGGLGGDGSADRSSPDEEYSLRPPAESIMLKPKTPSFMPKYGTSSNRAGATASPPPEVGGAKPPNQIPTVVTMKPTPIEIKAAPKPGKKDKGLSKAAILAKVGSLLDELSDIDVAFNAYKEVAIPEKFGGEVVTEILKRSMKSVETEAAKKFLMRLLEEKTVSANHLQEGLKSVTLDWDAKSHDVAKLGTVIAELVAKDALPLPLVFDALEGGSAWPLVIDVMTNLKGAKSEDWLRETCETSKFPLINLLPVGSKSKEQLASVLDGAELSFLMPLLRVQRQLTAALEADSSPTSFYRYIKDCLDESLFAELTFVFALVSVVVRHIIAVAAVEGDEVSVKAKEKDVLDKFAPVIKAFLGEKTRLQVAAVYALQSVSNAHGFPKGMLLKWFMMFYDLEIVEEESFMHWKEDISDEHPGKGQALFQVNQWLTWLQEADSDDGEEENDESSVN
ncbi:unnamed protein product [Notodromas monacha]|uniref:Eukaryotic translation initiation factor 4 gamma 2 n=1 Tax=Notodromas monacha TaxID=399045 RepID=A0A7R9BTC3_9CRUS|nr:unnamed protein product [Notodromas monacha]CAG0920325.1 unnamed protein product [Notodromas monacha]